MQERRRGARPADDLLHEHRRADQDEASFDSASEHQRDASAIEPASAKTPGSRLAAVDGRAASRSRGQSAVGGRRARAPRRRPPGGSKRSASPRRSHTSFGAASADSTTRRRARRRRPRRARRRPASAGFTRPARRRPAPVGVGERSCGRRSAIAERARARAPAAALARRRRRPGRRLGTKTTISASTSRGSPSRADGRFEASRFAEPSTSPRPPRRARQGSASSRGRVGTVPARALRLDRRRRRRSPGRPRSSARQRAEPCGSVAKTAATSSDPRPAPHAARGRGVDAPEPASGGGRRRPARRRDAAAEHGSPLSGGQRRAPVPSSR